MSDATEGPWTQVSNSPTASQGTSPKDHPLRERWACDFRDNVCSQIFDTREQMEEHWSCIRSKTCRVSGCDLDSEDQFRAVTLLTFTAMRIQGCTTYKCFVCNLNFSDQKAALEHIKHHPPKEYQKRKFNGREGSWLIEPLRLTKKQNIPEENLEVGGNVYYKRKILKKTEFSGDNEYGFIVCEFFCRAKFCPAKVMAVLQTGSEDGFSMNFVTGFRNHAFHNHMPPVCFMKEECPIRLSESTIRWNDTDKRTLRMRATVGAIGEYFECCDVGCDAGSYNDGKGSWLTAGDHCCKSKATAPIVNTVSETDPLFSFVFEQRRSKGVKDINYLREIVGCTTEAIIQFVALRFAGINTSYMDEVQKEAVTSDELHNAKLLLRTALRASIYSDSLGRHEDRKTSFLKVRDTLAGTFFMEKACKTPAAKMGNEDRIRLFLTSASLLRKIKGFGGAFVLETRKFATLCQKLGYEEEGGKILRLIDASTKTNNASPKLKKLDTSKLCFSTLREMEDLVKCKFCGIGVGIEQQQQTPCPLCNSAIFK